MASESVKGQGPFDKVISVAKTPDGTIVVFMASGTSWSLPRDGKGWTPALPPIPGTEAFHALSRVTGEGGEQPRPEPGGHEEVLQEITGMAKEILAKEGSEDGKGLVLAQLAFFKGREIDLLPWIRSNWVQVKKTPRLAGEIHKALRLWIAAEPIL